MARDSSLRWDTRDPDLWLECFIINAMQPLHWPFPHCGSIKHFPDRGPFRLLPSSTRAGTDHHLDSHLAQMYLKNAHPSAKITTRQTATTHSATIPIDVTAVEVTTRPGAAQFFGSPDLHKPLPWIPIRPFILERELSNYLNKAFVRWLINNLWQGCAIGYLCRTSVYILW